MNELLEAIVADDRRAVSQLLKGDGGLATRLVVKPNLYRSRICHWLYKGDTALHLAAAGYRIEIMGLLLNAGANPNAAGNMRRSTPLHYAADGVSYCGELNAERQVAAIRCLLDNGADLHCQDKNGATPLHRAVRTRRAAAVRFLLKAGSDPAMRNKPGSTPFHLAVQNTGRGGSGSASAISAQRDIIEVFLSFGVSPKLKTSGGKSVAECARSEWIRELLKRSS